MSDTVLIVLIIAVAVVVVLFLFRSSLRRFSLKAGKEGLETDLETRETADNGGVAAADPARRPSVKISRNPMVGKDQEIRVGRGDVDVSENPMVGKGQKIKVEPEKRRKKK